MYWSCTTVTGVTVVDDPSEAVGAAWAGVRAESTIAIDADAAAAMTIAAATDEAILLRRTTAASGAIRRWYRVHRPMSSWRLSGLAESLPRFDARIPR
jgi:hypothetical protein